MTQIASESQAPMVRMVELGLQGGDEILQKIFEQELLNLEPMSQRSTLGETKVTSGMKEQVNRILTIHFHQNRQFGKITDAVYAMGRSIRKMLNVKDDKGKLLKESRRIVRC